MSEKDVCLFVGGPADGQWLPRAEGVGYEESVWSVNGDKLVIMHPRGTDPLVTFGRLLKGYRTNAA
jgi:hypothetical protein